MKKRSIRRPLYVPSAWNWKRDPSGQFEYVEWEEDTDTMSEGEFSRLRRAAMETQRLVAENWRNMDADS